MTDLTKSSLSDGYAVLDRSQPIGSGFQVRVPAEWEPQQCVWLAWPHNANTWPGASEGVSRLSQIPAVYTELVRLISRSTPVHVLAGGASLNQARQRLAGISQVSVVDITTNDVWVRDYGPTFVQSRETGHLHAVDWRYNAWGGKYPPWDQDAAATEKLCQRLTMPRVVSRLCVEGGAMEFDGDRRLLTTPMCLRDSKRNPGWKSGDVADEIRRQTGVTEIVWIDGGSIEGDDTDGHIDQLARFIDRNNVVAAVAPPDDPNHAGLEKNFQQLAAWGRATQPRVSIHPLMIPPPRHVDGVRVPESYCNFLRLGPDRLLLPSFHPETDSLATSTLAKLTDAKIELFDCRDLVWGLGALHCASRDQPAAT